MYFSDLQWCNLVSHELGYYHKKNCVCNNYRARQLREILRNCSTHNRDDKSHMVMILENGTLRCLPHAVKFKGSRLQKILPYKTSLSMQGNAIY